MTEAKNAKEAVVAGSAQWMKYYQAQEWKKLASLYSSDCCVLPPGQDVATGREACAKVWESIHKTGAARIVLKNVSTEGNDTSASEHSNYTIYDSAGKEMDHGKYVVIWKKIDGSWYLHYEILNTDVSPPITVKDEIVAATTEWENIYNSGDFEKLTDFYTENSRVFPSGRPVAEGMKDSAKAMQAISQAGGVKINITVDDVVEMGPNTAADRSHFRMYTKDGALFVDGKYVVVWKKVNGKWKVHYDIFNSNRG